MENYFVLEAASFFLCRIPPAQLKQHQQQQHHYHHHHHHHHHHHQQLKQQQHHRQQQQQLIRQQQQHHHHRQQQQQQLKQQKRRHQQQQHNVILKAIFSSPLVLANKPGCPATTRSATTRMKLGEALLRATKRCGELVPLYFKTLVQAFLAGVKDKESFIRASSLSNLGEVCRLSPHTLPSTVHEVNCN